MCGRFGLTRPERLDLERFGIHELPALVPRFNIAPGSQVLAVRERDGTRSAELLQWGLVPSWAKDPAIGARMANARSDTAFEKPSFRNAMKSRRCLILADVFYEWQAVPGASRKRPHAIRRPDQEAFAMGGIWEYWKAKEGEGDAIVSAAILTTDANTLMTPIHDRMPVIIPADAYTRWLDPRTPAPALQDLMQPCPSEWLEAFAISTRVNNPRLDEASVLEPVTDAE
ncbi:MAG: SOS response-associated peptidase [Gemmatimonadaceae bacterium]|nr:SOS response-associated peptidase [Gemmatimonadaceae bacterium]